MKALILAAGVGSRLREETIDKPKALVDLNGRSLLFRQLDRLAAAGIPSEDVVVVGGYRIDQLKDAICSHGFACKVVFNEQYEPWGNFYSVLVAERELRGHAFLQLDGDVVLDDKILPGLITAPGDALLVTDPNAVLDDDAMKVQLADDGTVYGLDKVKVDLSRCVGEYIGVTKLSASAGEAVFRELSAFKSDGLLHEYYDHSYERLSRRGEVPFGVFMLTPDMPWREIDDDADLRDARARFT
jgi:choline kinase